MSLLYFMLCITAKSSCKSGGQICSFRFHRAYLRHRLPARCRYQYGIKKSPVSSAGRLWRAFRPGPDLQHPERNRTFYYSLFCHQTSKRHYRCFLRVYLILYPLKRHLPEYDQNPPHSEPAAPVTDRPALLRKTVAPAGSSRLFLITWIEFFRALRSIRCLFSVS